LEAGISIPMLPVVTSLEVEEGKICLIITEEEIKEKELFCFI
jgi:hypothetical protein